MTRKCSHCGHNGHNSRTCPDRGVRLFGVRLTEGMRKSASMGNLSHYSNHSATSEHSDSGAAGEGYLSDGLVQTSSNARERKKGVPWTEEEHRCFLLGLQKLGKGDWRGISKNFVTSRTPTQVASHAQKYFIRQSNLSKRKRRSSLFDISPEPELGFECFSKVVDVTTPLHQLTLGTQGAGNSTQFNDQRGMQGMAIPIPVQHFPVSAPLGLSGMPLGSVKEDEANERGFSTAAEETAAPFIQAVPVRFPVPVWIGLGPSPFERPPGSSPCNLVKPTATLPTAPVRIDNELPQLRLGISPLPVEPSPLSLKLDEPSARHSAFHPKASYLQDGKGLNVPISVV